ncbi:hypothetical protein CBS63078_8164 [Aspergillus niger]|uniref:Contig An01c0220, genomic contig n=5 Tax=Aspergillus TaxID=5052 RepID=A2Q913_ASPNC|nr:uncharacterized protein An01g06280 [Aspergillus niger]XP_025456040.1 uncharacterized protein BO96DRAFT_464858 [Aspergillus niger CBS 101883]EHA26526.1 hypothetical protein ASPNIDRAFT_36048 [Aspergillus niger ATCC 1015]RDH17840.1 hypothetical protein M747DRAFT_297534 [Aspergillus niger ATCC 13496]RDK46110.1 hypothetical protein M752DRAFT_273215 [Aspergillus phoenicis ATCC 13157]KAI2823987.1 hypothetical protein CBS115989_806 [Aspergillus niger]KAI2833527.1 hypothetical protein CBS133816_397|eukprot:XP_001389052.1 IgE-binding protein [Aspergillus niger CBS 513.88]
MKFTLASTLLPLLAAAAPAQQRDTTNATTPSTFGIMSARSGSPIHLLPLNANSGGFYLGGNTSSYCPISSGCPAGTETVFAGDGSALDVEVPGGQQVYVAPSGALTFTVPHSAYIPAGSSTGPFKYTPGKPFGSWTFTGAGATGFMACPDQGNKWQVFAATKNATVPSGNVADCLGFDALAVATNGSVAAWEYI